jgi:O-antigen/teichoic acid export membrane protein
VTTKKAASVSVTRQREEGVSATGGGATSNVDILATAKGWGFLAGGRVIEFGSRFIITLLLARILGVQDYGLYVLSISAVTLFAGVAYLGLDQALVRYVAILSSRKASAGLRGALQVGFGVSAVAGAAMGAALYLGAAAIAEGLFDEPRLTPLLRVLAVVLPFLVISNLLAATARGFRRMDYSAFAEQVVQSVARMLLLGTFALVGTLDVFVAAILFGVSDVAATITLIVLLNKLLPIRTVFQRGARRDVKPIVGFAFPMWLSGLLLQFRRSILTLTLGGLSSVASVSIFAIAARVNDVGHTVLGSITIAVRPIVAQLHDKEDQRGLSHLYRTTTRWTFTLNLPFFLLMVLYPAALLSLFGETFARGAPALTIMAIAELVNAATGVCQAMIDMTGRAKLKLANSLLWTITLVASSAVLIPLWGVVGAATAMLISTVAVNLAAVVEVRVLERLLPFDRSFWKPLVAGAAAFVTGWVLRYVMPIENDWRVAAIQAGVVLGIFGAAILAFGLAPEDRIVIDRVVRKVRLVLRRHRRRSEPTESG